MKSLPNKTDDNYYSYTKPLRIWHERQKRLLEKNGESFNLSKSAVCKNKSRQWKIPSSVKQINGEASIHAITSFLSSKYL